MYQEMKMEACIMKKMMVELRELEFVTTTLLVPVIWDITGE
jgi:hypothetical protein